MVGRRAALLPQRLLLILAVLVAPGGAQQDIASPARSARKPDEEGSGSQECPDRVLTQRCSGPASPDALLQRARETGYDKTLRPPCGDGTYKSATVVEVQLYLVQVHGVNEKLGHVQINGYLRSWWQDPRLAFNSTAHGGCVDRINMMGDISKEIWRPDIYVDNLVRIEVRDRLTAVYADGSVWQSEQVLMTVATVFRFEQLPYDKHTGEVVIASYSQDVALLRLKARHGQLGVSKSGDGLVTGPMFHSVWSFPQQEEHGAGFTTLGYVETRMSWDYLTLSFDFARKPKYFIEQIMLPGVLFLGVSYIQFWVDPQKAPARAAVAILPVLIMRTMSSSLYTSLPEGSQTVWLLDFLSACLNLSVIAAAEFAFVQFWEQMQKKRSSRLTGLQQHRVAAEKLIRHAKENGITLLAIVSECSATRLDSELDSMDTANNLAKSEDPDAPQLSPSARSVCEEGALKTTQSELIEICPANLSERTTTAMNSTRSRRTSMTTVSDDTIGRKARSRGADKYGVKEGDLLFIRYAQRVFLRFTTAAENSLSPDLLRRALRQFDIYMSSAQVATAVCMFLRDEGLATPEDESTVALTFCEFATLLLRIEDYWLVRVKDGNPFRCLHARVQATPPSTLVDWFAKLISPPVVSIMILVFYLLLPMYEVEQGGAAK